MRYRRICRDFLLYAEDRQRYVVAVSSNRRLLRSTEDTPGAEAGRGPHRSANRPHGSEPVQRRNERKPRVWTRRRREAEEIDKEDLQKYALNVSYIQTIY